MIFVKKMSRDQLDVTLRDRGPTPSRLRVSLPCNLNISAPTTWHDQTDTTSKSVTSRTLVALASDQLTGSELWRRRQNAVEHLRQIVSERASMIIGHQIIVIVCSSPVEQAAVTLQHVGIIGTHSVHAPRSNLIAMLEPPPMASIGRAVDLDVDALLLEICFSLLYCSFNLHYRLLQFTS